MFPFSEICLVDVRNLPDHLQQQLLASPRPPPTPFLRAALFPFLIVSVRLVSYYVLDEN